MFRVLGVRCGSEPVQGGRAGGNGTNVPDQQSRESGPGVCGEL